MYYTSITICFSKTPNVSCGMLNIGTNRIFKQPETSELYNRLHLHLYEI